MDTQIPLSALLTMILVYAVLNGIRATKEVDERYISLIGTLIGLIIGAIVGFYNTPNDLLQDMVLGALCGSNTALLDHFINDIFRH